MTRTFEPDVLSAAAPGPAIRIATGTVAARGSRQGPPHKRETRPRTTSVMRAAAIARRSADGVEQPFPSSEDLAGPAGDLSVDPSRVDTTKREQDQPRHAPSPRSAGAARRPGSAGSGRTRSGFGNGEGRGFDDHPGLATASRNPNHPALPATPARGLREQRDHERRAQEVTGSRIVITRDETRTSRPRRR